MVLLITRPEPDASRSAEKLRERGYDVLVSPVLETVFSDEPLKWDGTSSIAVTSRNGIRSLTGAVSAQVKENVTLYTVGDATAQIAKEAGFQQVISASGTVDDLVSLISERNVSDIHYVCGVDRKGDLEGKLRNKKVNVTVFERYKACAKEHLTKEAERALQNGQITGLLFYSQRSAGVFKSILTENKLSYTTKLLPYFCLAKSIRSVFDGVEPCRLVIAGSPDEKALFEAVDRFFI